MALTTSWSLCLLWPLKPTRQLLVTGGTNTWPRSKKTQLLIGLFTKQNELFIFCGNRFHDFISLLIYFQHSLQRVVITGAQSKYGCFTAYWIQSCRVLSFYEYYCLIAHIIIRLLRRFMFTQWICIIDEFHCLLIFPWHSLYILLPYFAIVLFGVWCQQSCMSFWWKYFSLLYLCIPILLLFQIQSPIYPLINVLFLVLNAFLYTFQIYLILWASQIYLKVNLL